MRLSIVSTLVVALAAENVVASTWLGTKTGMSHFEEFSLHLELHF